MPPNPGIYVEILVPAALDDIWRYTQTPDIHQRWDLRFTEISYLPKRTADESQRFLYSTRIGFGLHIDGEGESTGTREGATGILTSALKFWSADPRSLIRDGSGYWRYIPTPEGVRFLTWYDYRTRFGTPGRILDRLLFRPLMGWATAWSFDRLRLWLTQNTPPETTIRMAAIHALCRIGIAAVWFWHGLVPKLLFPNSDEKAMLLNGGLPPSALPWFGITEILLGVATLALWRWRPLLPITAGLMALALVAVAAQSPVYLTAAFNPVSLNLSVALLAIAGYLAAANLPSASRCLRKPPEEDD